MPDSPSHRRAPVRHYTIGQAARLSGLTARAIRLYEARGLIHPERCRSSGVRYFREEHIAQLDAIGFARRAGLSLGEIADLLDAGRLGGREAELARRIEICRARIEFLDAQRRQLEQMASEATRSLQSLQRLRAHRL